MNVNTIVLAGVALLSLRTLDGRDVFVNPKSIASIQDARDDKDPAKQGVKGTHCIINLLDGKFVAVEEDCDSIKQRLER